MTATATVAGTVMNDCDVAWNEFLRSLPAWELHRLTKENMEMFLHDEFVLGLVTLEDVKLTLSFDAVTVPPEPEKA